jgi:hypothetical protein
MRGTVVLAWMSSSFAVVAVEMVVVVVVGAVGEADEGGTTIEEAIELVTLVGGIEAEDHQVV